MHRVCKAAVSAAFLALSGSALAQVVQVGVNGPVASVPLSPWAAAATAVAVALVAMAFMRRTGRAGFFVGAVALVSAGALIQANDAEAMRIDLTIGAANSAVSADLGYNQCELNAQAAVRNGRTSDVTITGIQITNVARTPGADWQQKPFAAGDCQVGGVLAVSQTCRVRFMDASRC